MSEKPVKFKFIKKKAKVVEQECQNNNELSEQKNSCVEEQDIWDQSPSKTSDHESNTLKRSECKINPSKLDLPSKLLQA